MSAKTLPAEFLSGMEHLLGEEFPDFLKSYEKERLNGLRVNTLKLTPEEFEEIAPFPLKPVPWIPNGYYVDYRDQPARSPYFQTGLYYLQEPSAMTPASILPIAPGDRVLDLCAAPGGKATELGARLRGQGLLAANEISHSRAKALLRNLEQFGISNAVVLNALPAKLASRFPDYFDSILVDAPCSGEGMFRKDDTAISLWTPAKEEECAAIQRDLILYAAEMLRPGGYLLYSTCTFTPLENECVIQHLLKRRPDFSLCEIPRRTFHGGSSEGDADARSFAPGFPAESLRKLGYPLEETERESGDGDLTKTVRLWPHRIAGEGHFLALLQRREDSDQGNPVRSESMERPERSAGLEKSRKKRKDRGREGDFAALGALSAAERDLLSDFQREQGELWEITGKSLEKHGGKVYLNPADTPDLTGIPSLRKGLYLGEIRKDRFEPSQELAMTLPRMMRAGDGRELRRISFARKDERISRYLRGETISLSEGEEKLSNGWVLVSVDGFPLGWAKLVNGTLKNKYLTVWRIS